MSFNKKVCLGFFILCISACPVLAEGGEEATPVKTSADNRSESRLTINGAYAPYSFIVSGKKGVQVGWLFNDTWTMEGEYFSGSYGLNKYGLNLASFEERLFVLHARHYLKNSLNLTYGVGMREYTVELGNRITDQMPETDRVDGDLLLVRNYVLDFGIGNRWQFANGITFGADWFTMQTPIGPSKVRAKMLDKIEDEGTKNGIHKLLHTLKYFPTLTALKMSIGYTF